VPANGSLSTPQPINPTDVRVAPDHAIGFLKDVERFFVPEAVQLGFEESGIVAAREISVPEALESFFTGVRIWYNIVHTFLLPARPS